MKLHALDIPETREDIARWLEGYLMGPDLSDLVAQLSVFADEPGSSSPPLQLLLNGDLPTVIRSGLSVLSLDQLQRLLAYPECLFDLQELILANESAFWDSLLTPIKHNSSSLLPLLGIDRGGKQNRWRRYRAIAVSSALAASLAAIVTYSMTRSGRDARFIAYNVDFIDGTLPQGGKSYELLKTVKPPGNHFRSLASSIEELVDANRPYDTAIRMAHLLNLLMANCDLWGSPSASVLTVEDQNWLRDAAARWKSECQDAFRAAALGTLFESSSRPLPDDARIELTKRVEKIVTEMIKELRAKGTEEPPNLAY